MNIPKEIINIEYKYKKISMISGYYYFDIEIQYENYSPEFLNKRYSEIKEFHKLLKLKCPGCLIPKIKSKSILSKITISDEEKKKIVKDVQKFLKYLINHPILSQCDLVSKFFSNKINLINRKVTLNQNNIDGNLSSSPIINEKLYKSDNINIEKNNNNLSKDIQFDDYEILEKDDYNNIIEDEEEDQLLNMFNEENNKMKGIISKSKSLITSTYNYIKSFSKEVNNDNDENANQGIHDVNSLFIGTNIQEKDFESIKTNFKELGENIEINEYEKKIVRIKEAFGYLINNFKNEIKIKEKEINSLENIVQIFKENEKDNDEKNLKEDLNKKDDDDNIENKKDNNKIENLEKKLVNHNINKLEIYSKKYKDFIFLFLNPTIDKMVEYEANIKDLLDIFYRKKKHLHFFIKLMSQLNENERKQKLIEEGDNESKKKVLQDIDFFKKKIEKDKKYINKLNNDLKYEINNFKENHENSIYIFINSLYKNNYLKQCELFDIINKEMPFDSDSEISSKNKEENVRSSNDLEEISKDEENNKNDKKDNKNENENDFEIF